MSGYVSLVHVMSGYFGLGHVSSYFVRVVQVRSVRSG